MATSPAREAEMEDAVVVVVAEEELPTGKMAWVFPRRAAMDS